MGKAANVRAIQALTELRNALRRFGRGAQEALASAEIEIRRTQEWLREREAHWRREVEEARAAYEDCLAEEGSNCAAEEAALHRAEAELRKVQYWQVRVEQAVAEYRRYANRLKHLVKDHTERAQAFLDRRRAELESYIAVPVPQVAPASTSLPPLNVGGISADRLPEKLELGEEVAQEMEALWRKSVQDVDKGMVKECAATLISQEGKFLLINPVEGMSASVTPIREVSEGQEFVGTFHTHPYEDGTTAAFSGQDIAYALEHKDPLTLVRSGDEVFALMRTNKTAREVDASKVKQEFEQVLAEYMDNPAVSFSEAVYLANIELCRRYGLAFYRGKGESLKEVFRP